MTEIRWIDAAAQAKLLRAALKREFPATKFSVTISRYAGGSSVRIKWTDGPTPARVKAIASQYEGGSFDGSIDLAYSWTSWLLPDGSAIVAKDHGTQGSTGYAGPRENPKPHPDAELVRFSAHYIDTDRTISPALAAKCIAQVGTYYGIPREEWPVAVLEEATRWNPKPTGYTIPGFLAHTPPFGRESWSTLIYQASQDATRFERRLTPEQGAALIADAGRMTSEEALQLNEALAARTEEPKHGDWDEAGNCRKCGEAGRCPAAGRPQLQVVR